MVIAPSATLQASAKPRSELIRWTSTYSHSLTCIGSRVVDPNWSDPWCSAVGLTLLLLYKLNPINWPAPYVWVFIAQLVEHCSTNAEAMGLNNYSIKAPPPLFFCSGKFVIALLLVTQLWLSLYLHWNTIITYKLKEALTPAKKDQSGHVTVDQLSAFDKVLAECDQEAPVKFADFLDSRYSWIYFNLLELFTLQLALHWMKFITHLSPINFYLTEKLNLLVFLRHNVFTVDTKWVACYN